jgi:hypothetical protein
MTDPELPMTFPPFSFMLDASISQMRLVAPMMLVGLDGLIRGYEDELIYLIDRGNGINRTVRSDLHEILYSYAFFH